MKTYFRPFFFAIIFFISNAAISQNYPCDVNTEYKEGWKVQKGNGRLIYQNVKDNIMLVGNLINLSRPEHTLCAVRLTLNIVTTNLKNDTILAMYRSQNFFTWPNKNLKVTFVFQNANGGTSDLSLEVSDAFEISYSDKSVTHQVGLNIPEQELIKFSNKKLVGVRFPIYGEYFNTKAEFPTIFIDYLKCFKDN